MSAELCEHAGHEWADAGGGLEICMVCESERWSDDSFCTDCQKPLSAHEKCDGCGHYVCDCICDFLRDDWPTHPSNPEARS